MSDFGCGVGDRSKDLRERAHRDHAAMRGVVASVADAVDRHELHDLLLGFRVILEVHHEFEEGEGGLFEALVDSAPQNQAKVTALRLEHRALVQGLETLIALSAAEAVKDKSDAEVFLEVRVFITSLHKHDASENELLMDSIYTDIGGRG